MEPVGLAVGIAGLAGLFSTCIDCFNIVQQGRYFGRDFLILEAKYANQRLRLQTWGRACGITDACHRAAVPWNEDVRLAVETTLQRMAGLFQDHRALHSRYGLSRVQSDSGKTTAAAILGTFASKLQARATSLVRAHAEVAVPWPAFQRRPALPTAMRWAVNDKAKFADLVQHLKDFNDDLEALTTELDVRQLQRDLIREEVGSIIDVEELETIETARMGVSDPVADAASLRLWQIQESEQRPATAVTKDETMAAEVPSATPAVSSTEAAWEFLDQPIPSSSTDNREGVPYQVLHRVMCDSQPVTIFFDEPNYHTTNGTSQQWLVVDECNPLHSPAPLHLAGKRALPSLRPYLEQNSHLAFVLFKEYTCCHETITARTAESTESCIYLMSDALCSTLKSLQLKADPPLFCPTMELRSPYEWFYHNRALLQKKGYLKGFAAEDAETERAAKFLLDCVKGCMASTYEGIVPYKPVRWEHLPLVFPPGGIVVERHSESDDDDRAFVQVGPVHFTGNTDGEVLELTVTDRLDRLTGQPLLSGPNRHGIRKLHIPRSLFHNSGQEAHVYNLPVRPHGWEGNGQKGYLVHRGRKYDQLARETHLVTDQPEGAPGFASGLDQYIIDVAKYERLQRARFTDLTERDPNFDNFRDENQLQDWQCLIEEERDLLEEVYSEKEEIGRAMEEREGHGDISPERTRFFTCRPHVMYGFHLRDHTWKKLLVRDIRWVPAQEWGPAQDMVVGESEKTFLERLLAPRHLEPYETGPHDLRESPRIVMAIRGAASREAMDAVSIMAKRRLYHVRIATESGADSADSILQQAASLAREWGCMVGIEASSQRQSRDSVNAALLRFLDAFKGIVVFVGLPLGDGGGVDPKIEQRLCANLYSVYTDRGPAYRRVLWEQYLIKPECEECLKTSKSGGRSLEEDKYIEKLAAIELSWDTIRSLVDAVAHKTSRAQGIDWELLVEMAEKKAPGYEPPAVVIHR